MEVTARPAQQGPRVRGAGGGAARGQQDAQAGRPRAERGAVRGAGRRRRRAGIPPSREAKGKDSAAQFVRRMPLPAKSSACSICWTSWPAATARAACAKRASTPPPARKTSPFPPLGRRERPAVIIRVPWNRLIDGVFVPNGKAGPGATRFGRAHLRPARNQRDQTPGRSGRGGRTSPPNGRPTDWGYWVYAMRRGGEYMPDDRGLLGLHAERRRYLRPGGDLQGPPRRRPPRSASAPSPGLANPQGLADVWVFVDGRLKFQRAGLRQADGPVRIDVPLEADDRFLTLVSTDGDRGTSPPAIGSSSATPCCTSR